MSFGMSEVDLCPEPLPAFGSVHPAWSVVPMRVVSGGSSWGKRGGAT